MFRPTAVFLCFFAGVIVQCSASPIANFSGFEFGNGENFFNSQSGNFSKLSQIFSEIGSAVGFPGANATNLNSGDLWIGTPGSGNSSVLEGIGNDLANVGKQIVSGIPKGGRIPIRKNNPVSLLKIDGLDSIPVIGEISKNVEKIADDIEKRTRRAIIYSTARKLIRRFYRIVTSPARAVRRIFTADAGKSVKATRKH